MEDTVAENSSLTRENMEFDIKDNEVFKKVIFEPIRIGPVSTLDEMDGKVLQFQNKKLEMKLEDYQRIENELQQRIEQLEKRQSQDKSVMNVVNRYWNHLNDDVKAMLLEFDDECQSTIDEIENDAAISFIKTLVTCNDSQIDDSLRNNIEMSTSALTKIIQAYDNILLKNDGTIAALKCVPDNVSNSIKNLDLNESLAFDDDDPFLPKRLAEENDGYKRKKNNRRDSPQRLVIQNAVDGFLPKDSRHSRSNKNDITEPVPNSDIVTDVVRQPNNENCELEVTSLKKSNNDDPKRAQRERTKTIDIELSACHKDVPRDGRVEIEDVRRLVYELVEKVAGKCETICEDVELAGVISHEDAKDGDDDVFVTDALEEKPNLAVDSDDIKFHEKLLAVKMTSDRMKEKSQISVSVLKELKNVCVEITNDNVRLQHIINSLQDQCYESSLSEQKIMEQLKLKEQEYEEWKIRVDDIEYENEKLKYKKFKIERHLSEAAETLEKLKMRERSREKCDSFSSSGKKFEELEEELELQRELALKRSQELESLRAKYQSNLDLIEELEKNLNDIPENEIEDTAEYKCLQSQYSVLYNDTIQIKGQIEEYHAHMQTLNDTFANKMEMTENEDLMTLRKLQADLLQMQQANSQLRREYQMLKIEFERNLVANEQTAPLNKEMRHLIVRLQKHNKHLKHEAQRYKRRYKELNAELNLLSKQSYSDSKFKLESEAGSSSDFDENDYGLESDDFLDHPVKDESLNVKKEKLDPGYGDLIDISMSLYERPLMAIAIKQEPDDRSSDGSSVASQSCHLNYTNAGAGPSKICSKFLRKRRRDAILECRELLSRGSKKLRDLPEFDELDDEKLSEDEYVQDLRNQLKKAEIEQKELKLLLDMYKSINRDKREKMQLAMAEKKLKADIEETKAQMRRILELKRENRKKLADEDALRKIKYLEEQNFLLLRQINVHKQEEEALLSEMEVTNQAFEDMQEQNSRLIQQLREKDDANSKLMAERIKSNLLYKITREEKESLQALINATAKQLDSVTTVMNELEEKEQVYQTAINKVEKEINLRQQALELHRKKALEHAQSASDLKLNLEKYLADMKEAKQSISEKSSALHAENFKYNRLQEEIATLHRQVKRMKKIDSSETPDIVLLEEIREYKEMLTCQSCKVRRKDAVLSKCFHVFCWECLRTRYETRQRKCPKCNATFGANDYHRLFFAN